VTVAFQLDDEALESIAARVGALLQREPRYLSKGLVCEKLGIPERTLRTWREHGCPGIRVGREVMYDLEAIERWIEEQG